MGVTGSGKVPFPLTTTTTLEIWVEVDVWVDTYCFWRGGESGDYSFFVEGII
jgi:hypothetical protein